MARIRLTKGSAASCMAVFPVGSGFLHAPLRRLRLRHVLGQILVRRRQVTQAFNVGDAVRTLPVLRGRVLRVIVEQPVQQQQPLALDARRYGRIVGGKLGGLVDNFLLHFGLCRLPLLRPFLFSAMVGDNRPGYAILRSQRPLA